MTKDMLNKGITSQGVVSKTYDKYGKRMYVASARKDMSKKDGHVAAKRSAGTSSAVTSNTVRKDVGI